MTAVWNTHDSDSEKDETELPREVGRLTGRKWRDIHDGMSKRVLENAVPKDDHNKSCSGPLHQLSKSHTDPNKSSNRDRMGQQGRSSQGAKLVPPRLMKRNVSGKQMQNAVRPRKTVVQNAVPHVFPTVEVKTGNSGETPCPSAGQRIKSINATDQKDKISVKQKRQYPMGFRELESLCAKETNEVLFTILAPDNGFDLLLNKGDGMVKRDVMALVILAIGKACKSSHTSNVACLVNKVMQNNNFIFISVQYYLASFQSNKNDERHLQSLTSLLEFFYHCQQCLPANASRILPVILPLFKVTCQKAFQNKQELLTDIEKHIKEVEEEKALFLEEHSQKQTEKLSKSEQLCAKQPPENYRSVPVLPCLDDIKEYVPFLRPNVINGKYSDVEHYLDVQYRLLREDYVRPLREGIRNYVIQKQQNLPSIRSTDVRVYENVHIEKQEFLNGTLFHVAALDMTKLKNIKWEYSKRFLSGSLLCLSYNNFETMFFASVAHRNCEKLKDGLLIMRFEEATQEVLNFNPLINFVIMETSAYFEAYRHNLAALHEMESSTFPMQKYIVSMQKTISHPAYLKPFTSYDMSPLLSPLESSAEELKHFAGAEKLVNVLDYSDWPSEGDLGLDHSQYKALQSAITKEFSIIQGPPGTGKTYVGLRILQFLLHNLGSNSKMMPIFVVCYTNHALDQFLEGALSFTDDLIRIGGRSSNERLANYQLRSARDFLREEKKVPRHIFSNVKHTTWLVRSLQNGIGEIKKEIENSCKTIISENILQSFMKPEHYNSLKCLTIEYPDLTDDQYIISDWLGLRCRFMNYFGEMYQDYSGGAVGGMPVEDFAVEGLPQLNSEQKVTAQNNSVNLGLPSAHLQNVTIESQEEAEENEVDIEVIEAMRDIDGEDFTELTKNLNIIARTAEDDEAGVFGFQGNGWQVQGGKKQQKKLFAKRLHGSIAMMADEVETVKSVHTLNINDRWRLYRYWLGEHIKEKQNECLRLQAEIHEETNKLNELRMEEDLHLLKNTKVVGMTTTGAAKYRKLVSSINPHIIIVEEAAEILESHVVTSLTKDTQHLILIGDHQQLQPSPNVHELAVKYNLNVSLFERMVNNNMDFCQLEIQHRMRPTISRLLVPHIYPVLYDHVSVKSFENVKGVAKNVFFVSHSFTEDHVHDSTSKVNDHEAKFITALCKYFLLQGYSSSQITVLTTYSGQLFALKKYAGNEGLLKGVRMTIVDNFQGEENDIILISFVRSNAEGSIGFLKTSNRVCVALSRAKKGLFCIGNFDLLSQKSNIWGNILDVLNKQDAVGTDLRLQCQNHPETFTEVSVASDFSKVPEGGCTKPCEYRLMCGHTCPRLCHTYDLEHVNVRCVKACDKILCDLGHKCKRKCSQDCGPCNIKVKKIMPLCSHEILVPCHIPIEEFTCTSPCVRKLSCGHNCHELCGKKCTMVCHEQVSVSLFCGHNMNIECHNSACKDTLHSTCTHKCKSELRCGHFCLGTCGKCYQGRLHVSCKKPCKRILVCGHECLAPCSKSCPPCKRKCENRCVHSKCPSECGVPCNKCTEPCTWSCEHKKCTKLCGDICDREPCNEPCTKRVKCKHKCIGLCGEPCPDFCADCRSDVREIFFGTEDEENARFIKLEDCKHIFEVEGITHWMNDSSEKEIQMKSCPKCKTVIRKNLRFGNIVKTCLAQIEKVKQVVFGDVTKNAAAKEELLKTMAILGNNDLLGPLRSTLKRKRPFSHSEILKFENIANIAKLFLAFKGKLCGFPTVTLGTINMPNHVCKLTRFTEDTRDLLSKFLLEEYSTADQQQLYHITRELNRFKFQCELLDLLEEHTHGAIKPVCMEIVNRLCQLKPFKEEDEKALLDLMITMKRELGEAVINVTEVEKKLILKAMNLSQGHWYQCPRGHVYCITECGGAMEEAKCNECGSTIGGRSHSLRSDNRVATDMDGARHAAWSQANDLQNYDLRNNLYL